MANSSAPLKQSELTRYAKAMQAAGVSVYRIEIEAPNGSRTSIVVGEQDASPATGPNPCDRLLNG